MCVFGVLPSGTLIKHTHTYFAITNFNEKDRLMLLTTTHIKSTSL